MPTLAELQKKYGKKEDTKIKPISEPNDTLLAHDINNGDKYPTITHDDNKKTQTTDIISDISEISLNASARLNLLKFLYPLLTGKSTTNMKKKVMKKAVVDKLSKF